METGKRVFIVLYMFMLNRRRQNRESARRTRDRVRKYITVLEMYYGHVQKVNTLLIKQLEIMAKYCSNQLSEQERQNLEVASYIDTIYIICALKYIYRESSKSINYKLFYLKI